jgi:hypothetical protein
MKFITNLLDNPIGRMMLVILNTALGGTVLLLTILVDHTTAPFLLKYAILGAVGLIAGFTSRHLLKKNTQMLRLMVAITATVVSLSLLNMISLGYMGINLISRTVNGPDWDSLINMGLGILSAGLALYAWRPSKPKISPQPVAQRQPATRVEGWWNRVNLKLNKPFTGSRRANNPQVHIRSSASSNGRSIRSSRIKPQRRSKIFAWARRRNHQVQLSSSEEHSCPFCLEPVLFNDPRGVKICPECHTHHHADCWEVTGICQIPHYQN